MRLFVGIPLEAKVRDYLYRVERELAKLPAKFKFVAKKNLHITLKFMPNVNENDLEKIRENLASIKIKHFNARLTALSWFPSQNYAGVIWVGVDNEADIIKLQQRVDEQLLEFFPKDQRFKAHITLGRIKFIKNKEKFFDGVRKIAIEPLSFEISEFGLYQSILRKEGPEYICLQTYKLG